MLNQQTGNLVPLHHTLTHLLTSDYNPRGGGG